MRQSRNLSQNIKHHVTLEFNYKEKWKKTHKFVESSSDAIRKSINFCACCYHPITFEQKSSFCGGTIIDSLKECKAHCHFKCLDRIQGCGFFLTARISLKFIVSLSN